MRTRSTNVWLAAIGLTLSCGLPEGKKEGQSQAALGGDHSDRGDRGPRPIDAGTTPVGQECGLPVNAFVNNWSAAFPRSDLSLSSQSQIDIFALLNEVDRGTVPATFPSLVALSRVDQRMTIAAALIRRTAKSNSLGTGEHRGHGKGAEGEEGDHPVNFAVNCTELRRLVFGQQKSILQIAQALNLAAGSPLTPAQLGALPFSRDFLVWEIAQANDLGAGQHPSSHGTLTSTQGSIVVDPVKQLIEAFAGAVDGYDQVIHGQGHHATRGSQRWSSIARDQAAFDALLFELGDHVAPAPPQVASVPSPTNRVVIIVSGTTEAGATVSVAGGAAPASAVANATGQFAVPTLLVPNVMNLLEVSAVDLAGNRSAATLVSVRQDSIPPTVAISAPADGSSTDAIVITVTGTASDDFSLKAVRVNGAPAALSGGTFSASVTLVVGPNFIRAEAEDSAGNLSAADITVQHQNPPAFGLIGAAGGSISALGASITIPAGTFSQPTNVWISAPDVSQLPQLGPGIVALGPPIAIEAAGPLPLPVTIQVPLDPTLIPPVWGRASEVGLYTFDSAAGVFVPVLGAAQTGNTMTATVPHLTIFQAGVPIAAQVETLAGNGAEGLTDLTAAALDARAAALPDPEWTAVNGNGDMFVSSFDGTNTRVFQLKNRKLSLVGTLLGHGVGLVVNNSNEAFVGLNDTVWRLSGGPTTPTATIVAGGGVNQLMNVTSSQPPLSVSLGPVLGLALNPTNGFLYIIASQYFEYQPGQNVRLVVPPFSRPAPIINFPVCTTPSGGLNTGPLLAAVAPASLQSGTTLLYVANGQTLDVVNVISVAPAQFPIIWPDAASANCGTLPVVVPPGDLRTILPTGFGNLAGLAVSTAGDVYFTQRGGQSVQVVSGSTGCLTTLAGTTAPRYLQAPGGSPTLVGYFGVCGYDGDTRAPLGTAFFLPTGIALTKSGDLLVADAANNRLRLIYDASPAADPDNDGVPNDFEVLLGTDPFNPDSDGDGLSDGREAAGGTNPNSSDSDGDGIDDGTEFGPGPTPVDTDGDGIPDALEPGTEKDTPVGIPGEDILWLVTVHGFVQETETLTPSTNGGGGGGCHPIGTNTRMNRFKVDAPRHFIVYSGGGADKAETPASITAENGTFGLDAMACPLDANSQVLYCTTGTIQERCDILPAAVGLAPFGFTTTGEVFGGGIFPTNGPQSPTPQVLGRTTTTSTNAPTFTVDIPATAFLYKVPMSFFRRGRAFTWSGSYTVVTFSPGTTYQYQVIATPVRVFLDDIVSGNSQTGYRPDLNKYPTALNVKVDPPSFDGVPVNTKFRVTLFDTTNYPGCAMNAHNGTAPCPSVPDDDLDVKFVTNPTCAVAPGFLGLIPGTQALECGAGSPSPTASFELQVEDYAAYTKIKAEAFEFQIGTQDLIFDPFGMAPGSLGDSTQAFILGRPESEPRYTTLPIDRGPDNGQGIPGSIAGDKIADVGWKAFTGATSVPTDVADSRPVEEDNDATPSNTKRGDGFSVLEEYRGVVAKAGFRRLDPNVADLFVVTESAEGIGYADELPEAVHVLLASQAAPDGVVNFLGAGTAGHKDQKRVLVRPITPTPPAHAGLFGYTVPVVPTATTLVPNEVNQCEIYPEELFTSFNSAMVLPERLGIGTRSTIAHEIGHAAHMSHFAYGDPTRAFSIMVQAGTVPNYWINIPLTYSGDDRNLYQLIR